MDAGVGARSGTDQIITHGICEVCATDVLADIEAVELDVPERHSGSGLRRLDARTKLSEIGSGPADPNVFTINQPAEIAESYPCRGERT